LPFSLKKIIIILTKLKERLACWTTKMDDKKVHKTINIDYKNSYQYKELKTFICNNNKITSCL